ncbi:MAG: tRNA nucleotidyltransferase [Alphaproteobacteria bacterium]|nr:tRNA nucleotidyltransferase [Alphaproteobacteria bacterium]
MIPTQKIEQQEWMTDRDLHAVFAVLQGSGDPATAVLCVGGCVRDALMGRAVVDVDLATVHPPDIVMARLAAAEIDVLKIGIEHGTVVARFGKKLFQITSLRVDEETDGRHATVSYTDDWIADASRRDFTMNALYAKLDGNVFDPLGGSDDIVARRIRFIGDPHARIEEDALRILRFYRFHAELGLPTFDGPGLAACRKYFDRLARLSGERIRKELFKILMSPAPGRMLEGAEFLDLFSTLLPTVDSTGPVFGLAFIGARENALGMPDPLRRLAIFLRGAGDAAAAAARLRLSNDATVRLTVMAAHSPRMTPSLYPRTRKRRLYELGVDAWKDAVILSWARADARAAEFSDIDIAPLGDWLDLLRFPEAWPIPAFPIQGADVLALGVPQGPEIGRLLTMVENWWITRDFRPGRAGCLAQLRRRLWLMGLRKRLGFG